MKPAVAGKPASESIAIVIGQASHGAARPRPSSDRMEAPCSDTRSREITRAIANAAALVGTAMKVVIGVGAPWYTSGVHWWNGATDALKASPTAVNAMPVSRSGSLRETVWPIAAAIRARSVDPAEP